MTKVELANKLGISRSTLYYQPKQPEKDWKLKIQIEQVLHQFPSYGSPRIADELSRNEKAVARVMRTFGIKAYRRRPKNSRKKKDENQPPAPYQNLLLNVFPSKPHLIWASDFTYIRWRFGKIYLATVIDLCSRMIVGFNVLNKHTVDLVAGALNYALQSGVRPTMLHSDQGSEYRSKSYTSYVETLGIQISMSRKSCPWENGYQESFYSQFKLDLGDPNRFETTGELVAAIYCTIFIYNNYRIHTAFRMPPRKFYEKYLQTVQNFHSPPANLKNNALQSM